MSTVVIIYMLFIEVNIIKARYGIYGYRRSNGTMHRGIDVSTTGDPTIHSTVSGKVKYARCIAKGAPGWGATWEWGWFIWICADDGTDHIFAHCKANTLMLKEGQRVTAGQSIATMGNTGNAALDGQGPHVHYEVRRNGVAIDPTPYCGIPNKVGIYQNTNKQEENNVKLKIIEPLAGAVSSRQVHEGVIAIQGGDGVLRGYNLNGGARMAREYTEGSLSATFESLKNELQANELIVAKK